MTSKQTQPAYRAFLVRLWQESENNWRATLEDPHTGQRRAFADVDTLLAYIRAQVGPEAAVEKEMQ